MIPCVGSARLLLESLFMAQRRPTGLFEPTSVVVIT